jgi:hypothetical protein
LLDVFVLRGCLQLFDWRRRTLFPALFAACLFAIPSAFAQATPPNGVPVTAEPHGKSSVEAVEADHGLVLILAQDVTSHATPEAPDSDDLKACLANHPPLACLPISLTIQNQGKDTILSWSSSCGHRYIGFEALTADGAWEAIPKGDVLVCSQNILALQIIAPGESAVLRFRLADAWLELDTTLPPEDEQLHSNRGFVLLDSTSPHTIRAKWNIHGCIASDKLNPGSHPEAAHAFRLCETQSSPQFAALQSNALKLELPK